MTYRRFKLAKISPGLATVATVHGSGAETVAGVASVARVEGSTHAFAEPDTVATLDSTPEMGLYERRWTRIEAH
jgi:hypothetical protein